MSEIRDVVRISGDVAVTGNISASLSDENVSGNISALESVSGQIAIAGMSGSVASVTDYEASISIPEFVGEYYDGEYTVTPSSETQILQTQGLLMQHKVTINPIPSNYGRITWNGSVLTVS